MQPEPAGNTTATDWVHGTIGRNWEERFATRRSWWIASKGLIAPGSNSARRLPAIGNGETFPRARTFCSRTGMWTGTNSTSPISLARLTSAPVIRRTCPITRFRFPTESPTPRAERSDALRVKHEGDDKLAVTGYDAVRNCVMTIRDPVAWKRRSCLRRAIASLLSAASFAFVSAADEPPVRAGDNETPATSENLTNSLGSWIWAGERFNGQTCRFWRTFDIPPSVPVKKARLRMTVDDFYVLSLDGREIGRGAEWRELYD